MRLARLPLVAMLCSPGAPRWRCEMSLGRDDLARQLGDAAHLANLSQDELSDLKRRYYAELRTQDVVQEVRTERAEREFRRTGRLPHGAEVVSETVWYLTWITAMRRALLPGGWSRGPKLVGLTYREQHQMEQRVYGTSELSRGEECGLQLLGAWLGLCLGLALGALTSPRALTRGADLPLSVFIFAWCGQVTLSTTLPEMASRGGTGARYLRAAGWACLRLYEPLVCGCVGLLRRARDGVAGAARCDAVRAVGRGVGAAGQRVASTAARADETVGLSRRAAVAGDWTRRVVAPRARAVWRASPMASWCAALAARARSLWTQEALSAELRELARQRQLDEELMGGSVFEDEGDWGDVNGLAP